MFSELFTAFVIFSTLMSNNYRQYIGGKNVILKFSLFSMIFISITNGTDIGAL